jgi:hypothetical protein
VRESWDGEARYEAQAAQMFPCDACAINGQIRGGAGAVSHIKETWSSVEGARAGGGLV